MMHRLPTHPKQFSSLLVLMGVLVLLVPEGWHDHPLLKLFYAALLFGAGWFVVRRSV